jgi:hypothetical protein
MDEAENALIALGRAMPWWRPYQRDKAIVLPIKDPETKVWQLEPLNVRTLNVLYCHAANFLKRDKSGRQFESDPPDAVAETYLASYGRWMLPVLAGISNTPFLRVDGTVCETKGYDEASGWLYQSGEVFPPIPSSPSKAMAEQALKVLDSVLAEFPFEEGIDHSVALSGLLTVLDRLARPAPLNAVKTATPRTGKSLYVDVAHILMDGQEAAVLSQSNQEEVEKKINGELLEGGGLITIDNVVGELRLDFLCPTITQKRVSIRRLGRTGQKKTRTDAVFFVTGNNYRLGGDLPRRTNWCLMDAKCAHPELRTFKIKHLKEYVKANRGTLVTSALTVLRAYYVSGAKINVPEFGGFETWSERIRKPLVWLGHPDPYDTRGGGKRVKDDADLDALRTIMAQWRRALGIGQSYRTYEIAHCADQDWDFLDALLMVAATSDGRKLNPVRLGIWIGNNVDRIVDGLVLHEGLKTVHNAKSWQLDIA